MHSLANHVTLLTFASEKSASFSRSGWKLMCKYWPFIFGHALEVCFYFGRRRDTFTNMKWFVMCERASGRATCDSSLLLKVASRGAARAGWCWMLCAARGAFPMRRVHQKRALSIARSFPPRAAMSEFSHDSVQIPRAYSETANQRRRDAVLWIWFCKLAADVCLLLLDIN
jgi:hypothetical protein